MVLSLCHREAALGWYAALVFAGNLSRAHARDGVRMQVWDATRVWQHFRGSFLMVAESLLWSDIVGKA